MITWPGSRWAYAPTTCLIFNSGNEDFEEAPWHLQALCFCGNMIVGAWSKAQGGTSNTTQLGWPAAEERANADYNYVLISSPPPPSTGLFKNRYPLGLFSHRVPERDCSDDVALDVLFEHKDSHVLIIQFMHQCLIKHWHVKVHKTNYFNNLEKQFNSFFFQDIFKVFA